MRNSPHASTTNFILQCIPAGISVLYTDTISYGPMVLLNDIHSLGLNDFFVVSGSVWAYESGNMKYLIAPENVEKFYLPLPSKWWDEVDDPAIQTARQILVHAGRSESDPNLAYLLGLGAMDMIDHVVQEALRDQGGGVISVSDVYSQLAGLKDYPVLGGLFVADYAGGKRSPVMLRLWAVSAGSGWNPIGSFERIPELLKEESQ